MKLSLINLSLIVGLIGGAAVASTQTKSISDSQPSNIATTNNFQNTKTAIKNTSGASEIGLAKHLQKLKVKMYGAFWCPYCTKQKELFGKQAFTNIQYIECDPRGTNARPDLCRKAGVRAFPTWEIQGKKYQGMLTLQQLAAISDYRGQRNFKN
ncbi:MAG TPA: hypothetical protein VK184_03035 [Nostocaceae cyanobacterium]|nr:hypothetical protein [Nostocaceae cyanobacterium]